MVKTGNVTAYSKCYVRSDPLRWGLGYSYYYLKFTLVYNLYPCYEEVCLESAIWQIFSVRSGKFLCLPLLLNCIRLTKERNCICKIFGV